MLVRVEACGVCGTDIKKIQKGLLPGPRIFGHEICGRWRGGPGVARFREGDRVVVHHHIPCRTLLLLRRGRRTRSARRYKRNGTTAGFEPAGGGFAEYVKAHGLDRRSAGAIAVPDGVLAGGGGVRRAGEHLPEGGAAGRESARARPCSWWARGPIGLLLMQLCRWAGAEVLASDTLPDRLEMSRDGWGPSAALDARRGRVARGARGSPEGAGRRLALLAAVGQAAFRQAVDATRPGGRIMVFAATSPGETARGRPGRARRRREGDPHVVQRVGGRPGPGGAARVRPRGPGARSW